MKRYPLQEWHPFSDLMELPKVFGRWFEFPFGVETVYPAVDVYEDKNNVVIKAEIPGIDKDHLDISVENGLLSIKGEKKKETEVKKGNYYCLERSYGSFHRVIELPDEVDKDKVKASYKNGTLEITLLKKSGASGKGTRIRID